MCAHVFVCVFACVCVHVFMCMFACAHAYVSRAKYMILKLTAHLSELPEFAWEGEGIPYLVLLSLPVFAGPCPSGNSDNLLCCPGLPTD